MLKISLVSAFTAFLLLPAAAGFADEMPTGGDLNCNGPITVKDTAQTLLGRFKGEARITQLPGNEGESFKGVVIYPDDPAKRLEVYFFDDRLTRISMVLPAEGTTAWTVRGLKPGMPMAAIVAANGGNFDVYGFDWDYGGYVTNLKGGKLANDAEGCFVGLRFNPEDGKDVPRALAGEIEIPSDDPALAELHPYLSSVSLNWTAPDDQ